VEPESACQFPDPFYRVQFRAVRRQIFQNKVVTDLFTSFFMRFRMMISSVVDSDDDLLFFGTCNPPKFFQKIPGRISIEDVFFTGENELAVPQTHRSEIPCAFSAWLLHDNRLFDFGRNPHAAS